MRDVQGLYDSRSQSIDSALSLLRSHDLIFTAQAAAEPVALLEELHTIVERGVTGVDVQNCLPMKNYPFIASPEYQDHIFVHGWYFTPPLREAHTRGNVTYTPQNSHRAAWKKSFSTRGRRTVLMCTCSPMDRHGYLSLSVSNVYEQDLIDMGALLICEVNPHYPRTFGDNSVHISRIAALVETDRPVPEAALVATSEVDRQIGQYIADLVDDGSTIQLGIGNIPNATAEALREKRHLGIHTEMFTETMVHLIECGAVDNSQKSLMKGFSICSFAFGSRRLYDYLDDNPSVRFNSGSWVNNPYVIARNDRFVSINTTLEVDLGGQCASESLGFRQYSGTGGQADTVIGAQLSMGGKSVIALHSTAMTTNQNGQRERVSKIVPLLKEGTVVSLSRNDVDYVITEYGVAWLRSLSMRDRVKELIGVAHPDYRDWLRFEADRNMLW